MTSATRQILLSLLVGFGANTWSAGAEQAVPAPPVPLKTNAQAQDIEKLVAQLKSEVWREREDAYKSLSKLGAAALPFLPKTIALDDPELFSRVRALVQHAQLMANAKAMKGGADAAADLEGLLGGFTLQTPEGRIHTLDVLVKNAGRAIVPTLFKILETETSEAVQGKLVHELGWLGSLPDHQEQLFKFYEKAPDAMKGEALWALSSVPGEPAISACRKALSSDIPALRSWAARAVRRLGDRESLPALRKLALDAAGADLELRKICLEALMDLADEEAGQVYLQALDNAELRDEALRGIGSLRLAAAAPKLNELYAAEKNADSAEPIIKAIGLIGDPSALPVLREALKSQSAEVQISAAHGLRQMQAKEAGPDLALLLKNPVDQVRLAAIGELAALGYQEALPALRKLADSEEPGVRFEAAQALVGLGDPTGRQKIAEIALKDNSNAGAEATRLIGNWQIEEGLSVIKSRADIGNIQAQTALFQFNFDDNAFKEQLRTRLRQLHASPRNTAVMRSLSFFLAERGLYERAVKVAEDAVKLAPNDVDILRTANYSLHEVGKYAQCNETFERMEALQNPEAEYFNSRAWFYCTAFSKDFLRPGPSLALARRAAAMEPYEGHIADTLGWALHVNKRYDEAVHEMRRALDLREAGDIPQRSWQRARIARSLWLGGHKEEALAEALRATTDAPLKSDVWFEAAGFYASAGKRDESIHALHTAIQLGWVHATPLLLNPEFDALREDPGYRAALRTIQKNQTRLEALVDEVETDVKREPAGGLNRGRRNGRVIDITGTEIQGIDGLGEDALDGGDVEEMNTTEGVPDVLLGPGLE